MEKATVTSKKCDCCEHHEVGYVTESGKFTAFKTGDTVYVPTEDEEEGDSS